MDVVTIFGASGFLGRYIVRELAGTGARVRAAVRLPERANFLKPMGDVGQIVPVACNIRDDASVAAAVDGADTVVNLVGILFAHGRQTFDAVHVDGARRVAAAAQAAGAQRLLHVSAIGADERSESVYAASKGAGERVVREAFPDAAIFRPSIVFGPEDDFFNKFAAIARLSPALPLFGGGHTRFQPVYVGDVADAALAVLRDGAPGATFELGGPRVCTFRDLMELLLEQIGRRRLLIPVPFAVGMCQAALLELLPFDILTRDQIRQLRRDNVCSGNYPGLDDLNVVATAMEAILPTYLNRYRRGVWHT